MSIATQIDRMIEELEYIRKDAAKFDAGNNAAGTRVRKGMMDIKRMAQEVREEVTAAKAAK